MGFCIQDSGHYRSHHAGQYNMWIQFHANHHSPMAILFDGCTTVPLHFVTTHHSHKGNGWKYAYTLGQAKAIEILGMSCMQSSARLKYEEMDFHKFVKTDVYNKLYDSRRNKNGTHKSRMFSQNSVQVYVSYTYSQS